MTKTGLPFTYRVEGNAVWITRNHEINQRLNIGDFEVTYNLMTRDRHIKPSQINTLTPTIHSSMVRGPSYVWAILNDPRI